MFEYDDEAAVKFIQNHLPQELKTRFSDDDIYYLLDATCDFYEKRDWLSDDDADKEEQELVRYLREQAGKDDIGQYTEEEIRLFLIAEDAYSDTLDIPD